MMYENEFKFYGVKNPPKGMLAQARLLAKLRETQNKKMMKANKGSTFRNVGLQRATWGNVGEGY